MKCMCTTVLLSILWIPVAAAQTPAEKQATIAYLQALQLPSGGYMPTAAANPADRASAASLRATSSAVRAIKYLGGTIPNPDQTAKFVASCFDSINGGFGDTPSGKPDVATTAVGIMAAVELNMPLQNYRPAVVKYLEENAKSFEDIRIAAAGFEAIPDKTSRRDEWLAQVNKLHNADGIYGKGDGMARETGSAAVIVLRLGGEIDNRANVVRMLKSSQRPDGAFGKEGAKTSDLESTYRIMRGFMMMKEKPESVDACRGFIAKCRNADGGYGVAPGQASSASGTYFAAIVSHWLDS